MVRRMYEWRRPALAISSPKTVHMKVVTMKTAYLSQADSNFQAEAFITVRKEASAGLFFPKKCAKQKAASEKAPSGPH